MLVKINNIWSNLSLNSYSPQEYEIYRKILRFFSVEVPNSYFVKLHRPGWDGYVHYITANGNFKTGLLPLLINHIKDSYDNIDLQIMDLRKDLPKLSDIPITKFGKYSMEGEFSYQYDIVKRFDNYIEYKDKKIYFPRGIINAATNAGKMIIIGGIYYNFNKLPILILIANKELHTQLYVFFKDLKEDVGIITADTIDIRPITVAMVKTVLNRMGEPKVLEELNKFKILAVDECHLSGAATYNKVIMKLDIPVRVFLSGTAMDSESPIKRLNTVALSGSVLYSMSKVDLMNKNISRKVKVFINYCRNNKNGEGGDYEDIYKDFIVYSNERAAIINKIILDYPDRKILIAVDEIEHGEFINNYIQRFRRSLNLSTNDIEFVHGNHPDREDILNRYKNGIIKILISTKILQLGVNVPDIGVIIYAVGGKSAISVKQWMGRGERKSFELEELHFYDFYDDHFYIRDHSKRRIRTYQKEHLDIIYNFNKDIIL